MKFSFFPGYKYFLSLLIILLFNNNSIFAQSGVAINELMSSNRSTLADEDGDYPDWIELYNYGDQVINLEGWGLSDNYQNPFKWVFPPLMLQPDDFLIVFASGKNRIAKPTTAKVIIPEHSTWKYLDDGSNQGTAWRMPDFDDSHWSDGPAMLGYDTNNNTQFATEIGFGNNASYKHITYYFRKEFNISEISDYSELKLKLMIDDGAVVYLNGNEIARQNMPEGIITYVTEADVVVGTLDISYHTINAALLVEGNNTIAVEVHQFNRTSSDLRFDLELSSPANFLHTNFSISSDGEEIILTCPAQGLIDSIPPVTLQADVSYGRWPDGIGALYYYSPASPGVPNLEDRYHELSNAPAFSHTAGFYSSPFYLSLTSDPETEIIYTLDGSEPDPDNLGGSTFRFRNSFPNGVNLYSNFQSQVYSEPLYIDNRTSESEYISTFASNYNGWRYTSSNRLFKGTVVRAKAHKPGALPSEEIAATFFITPEAQSRYSLPIFSLITQADNLFDYDIGIYTPGRIWDEQANNVRNGGAPANYKQVGIEWERPGHLEFFDGDALEAVISQKVGVRIHGGWSRAHAMKSLRLYARNSYGEDYFNHRMFPDLPYENYKRLLLRNSGNDWDRSMFRDAAAQSLLMGLNCDFQAYRPTVLFINGEYWGIHNLRERYDRYYLNRVYGVDPDNLDILEMWQSASAKVGDLQHYREVAQFLSDQDMSTAANYQQVKTMIDIENFIDYQISQIYIANTDWPGNNNDFWRVRTNYDPYAPYGHDGRWRWMVFDTDFGLNLNNGPTHNTLNHATSPTTIWQNPPASTLFMRRLLMNEEFKFQFINRFADVLNTYVLPERAVEIIQNLKSVIEPEMPEHIQRWSRPGSMNSWHNEVNGMINFVNTRPANVQQHIINHFNISGLCIVNINISDPAHGHVKINTIDILPETSGMNAQPYPWSGGYFQGVPIRFEAVPASGYVFSHWEGLNTVHASQTIQEFNQQSITVKAHFKPANMLYSWNFNALPQGNLMQVVSDVNHEGVIFYAGNGTGYMDRVNEGTELNANTNVEAGYGLRVRNPSADRELVIQAPTTGFMNIRLSYAAMRTSQGASHQEIQYRTSEEGIWRSLTEPFRIEEDWQVYQFTFADKNINNNPEFAIRIIFHGQQTGSEAGNNRFDNIKLEGMEFTDVSIKDIGDENPVADMKIWYHQDKLFVHHIYDDTSDLIVYNINGTIVSTTKIHGYGKHSVPFDIVNGVFIGRIVNNKGSVSRKFIVIR